eukprot:GDKI01029793.1.p1 GENE.GDKI01029793.1~~GDKI01029793.1.p1  ORF type:complete len:160 (+),score=52.59 GDKI01029793.1:1-480(+)
MGDCQVTEWSQWEQCSVTCGGGQQSRSRSVSVQPANGGAACPTELAETQGCNADACPTTTAAPTTTTTTTTGPASSYVGCYNNVGTVSGSRPSFYVRLVEKAGITADGCYNNCSGYAYFGLINGNQCACANTYGTYGTSSVCAGGVGGKNAVDVYKRNY